jgi:hypothetical protein
MKVMNDQKLSPKYYSSKLSHPTLEDYIDVYEDQIKGWHLDFARKMHADEHAGFAALQIVFSYFEGHAVCSRGEDSKGRSREFFEQGVLSVFPELASYEDMNPKLLASTIDAMYEDGRCGFFHAGITRKRFILRDGGAIIKPISKTSGVGRVEGCQAPRDSMRNFKFGYVPEIDGAGWPVIVPSARLLFAYG